MEKIVSPRSYKPITYEFKKTRGHDTFNSRYREFDQIIRIEENGVNFDG